MEITLKQSGDTEDVVFVFCFGLVLWLSESGVFRYGLRTHRNPLQMEQGVNTVFVIQCYLPLFVLIEQKQW